MRVCWFVGVYVYPEIQRLAAALPQAVHELVLVGLFTRIRRSLYTHSGVFLPAKVGRVRRHACVYISLCVFVGLFTCIGTSLCMKYRPTHS